MGNDKVQVEKTGESRAGVSARTPWRHRLALLGIAGLLLVVVAACGTLDQPAPAQPAQAAEVRQVSADEIADAMEQDRFYADYGQVTLVVQGTVAAVHPRETATMVRLGTNASTKVLCEVAGQPPKVQVGDAVTVQAPAASVQRNASMVVLKNCAIR